MTTIVAAVTISLIFLCFCLFFLSISANCSGEPAPFLANGLSASPKGLPELKGFFWVKELELPVPPAEKPAFELKFALCVLLKFSN